MAESLKHRGAEGGGHPFKVTKVKGRATEQHINDKIANPTDKKGNDIADHLATKAYDLFHDHINQIANLYAHRTKHYVELGHIV